MSLVDKIQELCSAKNTTLIGLEREIGLGRGTIRNWDKNSPSIDKVQKVADYLGVTIDDLIGHKSPNTQVNVDLTSLPTETQIEVAKIILTSPTVAEIVKKINDLPPEKREVVFNLIKTM